MKTLPDAPNLEHLRRQAKDLLPQLRAVRPEAVLSDAQTLVAEQHGFRAWPDLKAEVDRRSAATTTVDDLIASEVAAAFDLGAPAGLFVAVERQWAGQAWSLTSERGRWLARRLFDWFDDAGLETEVLLAEAAAGAGIRTLRPVRSTTGAVVETVQGSRWRVYELPAIGPEPSVPADPHHSAAAGRIVATVHGLDLPSPPMSGRWLATPRPESQWWGLHHLADRAGMPWAGRLAEAIPAILDVTAVIEAVDAGQATVLSACHYAPNAFRTAGPDDLVVMSWEHAGPITARWDFGGALAAWSEGVADAVNGPAARAFVAGYAEIGEPPQPLDLGMFTSAVSSNLSWLASRMRIAVDAADADRREVAARAVPWLLDRLPSRAMLQAVLDAVRSG